MEKDNFIYRNTRWIVLAVTIICLVLACINVGISATKSIEDQKQNVFTKEQSLVQDVSSINRLERTRLYVSKDTINVTFIEDDCELNLVYDTDWNLLNKELKETHIGASFWKSSSYIVVVGICAFGVSGLACSILSIILEEISTRKRDKKSKKDTSEEE